MMLIIGVDEAGYGAIAGPLVVAAVAYPREAEPPTVQVGLQDISVQDSKTLTPQAIDALQQAVQETAYAYAVLALSSHQVDQQGGAYDARRNAMTLAIRRLAERLHLSTSPDREAQVIVDGKVELPEVLLPYRAVPRADATVWQVGAASIVAKGTQRAQMAEAHVKYPRYLFAQHCGYPTKAHIERLQKYGPCKIHRRTTKSLAPWATKPKGRE